MLSADFPTSNSVFCVRDTDRSSSVSNLRQTTSACALKPSLTAVPRSHQALACLLYTCRALCPVRALAPSSLHSGLCSAVTPQRGHPQPLYNSFSTLCRSLSPNLVSVFPPTAMTTILYVIHPFVIHLLSPPQSWSLLFQGRPALHVLLPWSGPLSLVSMLPHRTVSSLRAGTWLRI